MSCEPEVLKGIPLFALLDDDETAVRARWTLGRSLLANVFTKPVIREAWPT